MTPSLYDILNTVAAYHGLTPRQLIYPSRLRCFAVPRMVAAYLARMLTHESYPTIAEALGGQHHSTVIHSVHRARELMAKNEAMLDAVVGIALVIIMVTRRRYGPSIM